MNEEEIRDEARKAANRSQFMSNHIYDHKSYEDGFYEGMNQALRQYGVITSVCDNCKDVTGFYLGTTCQKCNRPFRAVKQTEL
jgi:hypothetical protein